MSNLSFFESRHGKTTGSAKEVYVFVTDLRNFERFIPAGAIQKWEATKKNCSFSVSMLGTVAVRLIEEEEYCKVVYNGDALGKNDFTLTLNISEINNEAADIHINLSADLNPVMKMMAVKPINQFLEMLIVEIEKFNGWKDFSL